MYEPGLCLNLVYPTQFLKRTASKIGKLLTAPLTTQSCPNLVSAWPRSPPLLHYHLLMAGEIGPALIQTLFWIVPGCYLNVDLWCLGFRLINYYLFSVDVDT